MNLHKNPYTTTIFSICKQINKNVCSYTGAPEDLIGHPLDPIFDEDVLVSHDDIQLVAKQQDGRGAVVVLDEANPMTQQSLHRGVVGHIIHQNQTIGLSYLLNGLLPVFLKRTNYYFIRSFARTLISQSIHT